MLWTPLKNDGVRQLGWLFHSQDFTGNIKKMGCSNHSPHQPGDILVSKAPGISPTLQPSFRANPWRCSDGIQLVAHLHVRGTLYASFWDLMGFHFFLNLVWYLDGNPWESIIGFHCFYNYPPIIKNMALGNQHWLQRSLPEDRTRQRCRRVRVFLQWLFLRFFYMLYVKTTEYP